MKSIFAVLFVFCAAANAADDGTVSVLTNPPAPVVADSVCCEQARSVKLAPWTVRRLNRVADRQEAREARKCCCNDVCKEDCCCNKPKLLVVENRRN